jgi:hypothetical protein
MLTPVLFWDRSRPMQMLLAGVIPAAVGALQGVLIGTSVAAYWIVGAAAAVGIFLSGFEHRDGWGGADHGLVAGAIYGTALLVVHAIVGTDAKVSLGSFPPFVAVIDALIGMLVCAAGGRIGRELRERSETAAADKQVVS